jgi:hypothetical protein
MNLVMGEGKIKKVYLKKNADIRAAQAYRRYQRILASYRQVIKEIDGVFNRLRELFCYQPGE